MNLAGALAVRLDMTQRQPSKKRLRTFCAEVSAEDGTDPRDWLKGLHGPRSDRRKARQLCAQVSEALTLLLAGEADEALRCLDVVSVEPAPDTSQMLVTVRSLPGVKAEPAVILDALSRASGRVRCEVAAAITRRRAPQLLYRVILDGAGRDSASSRHNDEP